MLKQVIEEKVYNQEISLCQKLAKEKGKCNWGSCKKCGVLFLLQKLHKGVLLEKQDEISETRKNVLGL